MSTTVKFSEENKGILIMLCGFILLLHTFDLLGRSYLMALIAILVTAYGFNKANMAEKVSKLFTKCKK